MSNELVINFTRRKDYAKLDETLAIAYEHPILFGRSAHNHVDVNLEEGDVSRRHMEIARRDDGFYATCLSSLGMTVNERKYNSGESVLLHRNDEVMLGGVVRFRIKALPEFEQPDDADGATQAMDDAASSTGETIAPGMATGATISPGMATGATVSPGMATGATISPGMLTEATIAPGMATGATISPGMQTEATIAAGMATGATVSPGMAVLEAPSVPRIHPPRTQAPVPPRPAESAAANSGSGEGELYEAPFDDSGTFGPGGPAHMPRIPQPGDPAAGDDGRPTAPSGINPPAVGGWAAIDKPGPQINSPRDARDAEETPSSGVPDFGGAGQTSTSGVAQGRDPASGKTVVFDGTGMVDPKMLVEEQIKRKERAEAKKRGKSMLRAFLVALLLVVAAAALWVMRPVDQQLVNFPMAGKRPDIKSRQIFDASGAHILDIYYPRGTGGAMRELEDGGVFSVFTYHGRNRDVPYRLSFAVRTSPAELELSLAESYDAWRKEAAAAENLVFTGGPAGVRDVLFFEDFYGRNFYVAASSHGMACILGEYTLQRQKMAWHGTALYFRNGDTAYILRREFPEKHWVRASWIMRENPNLAVYKEFNIARWESPGAAGLLRDRDIPSLKSDARRLLDRERISDWRELEKTIDTLMAATWSAQGADKEEAVALLAEFRARKAALYNQKLFAFANYRTNGDMRGMQEVFAECKAIFGADERDRHSAIFNNPQNWTCKKER